MSKEETRLWAALNSLLDAGYPQDMVMATAKKIGLIDASAKGVERE